MTKLTDMKITKKERKERADRYKIAGPMDGDVYPYGLQIRLDDAALDKLGIDTLPKTGKKVRVTAVCNVSSTSDRASTTGGKDQRDRSVELQIEQLRVNLEPASAEEAMDDAIG